MVSAKAFFRAAVAAGREFMRSPASTSAPRTSRSVRTVNRRLLSVVPIRSIGASHRDRIETHLLALQGHDRYLRFGYAANDEQIHRYVESLDFDRDEVFGIYNRRLQLIAMAHLAFSLNPELQSCAEFGVSVLAHARGRGYGARLFDRASVHARNEGVQLMFIHALSENTAMIRIARNSGATLEREGSETEAYLRLPAATLDSRVSAVFDQQMAQTDYRLKQQAHQFWAALKSIQDVRAGVRSARGKAAR